MKKRDALIFYLFCLMPYLLAVSFWSFHHVNVVETAVRGFGSVIDLVLLLAMATIFLLFAFRMNNRKIAIQMDRDAFLFLKDVPAVIFVGYNDWSVDVFNDEKFREITGYPSQKFKDREIRWSELVVDDITKLKDVFKQALKGNGLYVREYRIRKQNGDIIWLRERGQIIFNKERRGKYSVGVFVDISDLKTTEEERFRLEQQLQMTQRLETMGTLTGGIAHNFNNMMGMILGYTELLLLEERRDSVIVSLEHIKAVTIRASKLVKQLMIFSGKVESKFEMVDLNQVVSETAVVLGQSLSEGIAIKTSLASPLKSIYGDTSQLHQLIINLAANSRDAMLQGGEIYIATCVQMVEQGAEIEAGEYVVLSVTDTGEGIKSVHLNRIYEPFFTTKDVGKGTGLGLSTVFMTVKNHKGYIFCESEEGRGTTFRIYFSAM